VKPDGALPAVTGLRFYAAAWVVLFHAHVLREHAPAPLRMLGALGYAAVPLFFVLSGFVLTWTYGRAFDEGRVPLGRFFLARAARIYPLYLVGLVWMLALAWPALPPARPLYFLTLGLHIWQPSWIWLANTPAWSVSVELFLYAAFPFLIVLVAGGRSWLATRGGLFTLIAVAWAVSFVPWMATRTEGLAPSLALEVWPPQHLPELVIGMATARLAMLEASERTARDGSALVMGAIVTLLGIAWSPLATEVPFALLHNGLLAPIFAALVFGLARGGRATRPFSHPAIVKLGELGYAIYLLQLPLIQTIHRFWNFDEERGALLWVGYASYWLALVGISALAYRFVESPARAAIRGLGPKTQRALGVGAAGLLAVALGWTLVERVSDDWGPKVVLTGDFQEELGCARDGDAGCSATRLRRVEAAPRRDLLYGGTLRIPAGRWSAHVGIDDVADDGTPPRVEFTLEEPTEVAWLYSHRERRLVRVTPDAITAPGDYQHHLGCADWQPDCLASWLVDLDGDGVLEREVSLPAGHYAMKAAVGLSWDENYGRDGVRDGENVVIDVPEPGGRVRLRYQPATHTLTAELMR
jgi:peptidoglycan/LPS O-acetylase OafA/YrhL